MAEFIIKLTDTPNGMVEIVGVANPEKLNPFSSSHQFAYALQQNENLLPDFIQSSIDSIKVESEPRIVNPDSTK